MKIAPHDSEGHSVGEVLKEVSTSARDLVQSELKLARAEIKQSASEVGQHVGQAAIFGALLAISVFPFLAFLVIGLGRVMNGNYWLSSLLVAIACAAVGGAMAFRAYKKITRQDLSLPHTRNSLKHDKEIVTDHVRRAS